MSDLYFFEVDLFQKILIGIIITGSIIYLVASHDWRKNKLNTRPKKFREVNTKKVKKEDAQGISFGKSKDGIISEGKVTQSSREDEGHILAVGGSGLGKTSALLIPTLRNWVKNSGATFLCWDISGDINTKIRSDHAKVIKYRIGERGIIGYSPFGCVDRAPTDRQKVKLLIQLAQILMPKRNDASEAGDYYRKEGLKILKASLIAFYFEGLDFVEICEKVHDLDWHSLLNEIDATGNKEAIRFINGFADPDLPQQYTSSAKQNCEDAIELFATDDGIKDIVHRFSKDAPAWDPAYMESYNIFVIIDDADLEEYEQLNCLIANQCLDFIKKRPLDHTSNILFCMDEAASLGHIDILPPLRKFRKRHCRIFMLTQSISDIDLTWGEQQRKAMMTNFRYKVILECSEPDEQEYWSNLAGKSWQWYQNNITQNADGTKTYGEILTKENNIEPYTLANLGKNLVLISPDGAQILEKGYYFR